jgi:hypothetical protein
MADTYAKINMSSSPGPVVNMQVLSPTDPQDPAYTWVIITTQTCTDGSVIQIGCTYDGTNFYAANP